MQVLLVIAVQILFVCTAKGKGHVMTIRDAGMNTCIHFHHIPIFKGR